MNGASITVPVDVTNPGQFFACCGLLEVADRLWPGAEAWFQSETFSILTHGGSWKAMLAALRGCTVSNAMTAEQLSRLEELSETSKEQLTEQGLADEKKRLESLRRDLPIILGSGISILIDWFTDKATGGSRFKTWAGQQSVLEIALAMHSGIAEAGPDDVWGSVRGIGLPFNFDSDLGGQGSALDVGFSFDALSDSRDTRINGACKPLLEFLSFIGLQRFRPREIPGETLRENRFVYSVWKCPLPPSVASAVACGALRLHDTAPLEFKLFYRTKYLKSFLPAIPLQGDQR